jgi:hypothetical protein
MQDLRFTAEVREAREVVDPIDQTTDILNAMSWVYGSPNVLAGGSDCGEAAILEAKWLCRRARSAHHGSRQPGSRD